MSLTDCLGLLLAQTGAGALLFSAWLPVREIRPGFFSFQSFLGAVLVALATSLHGVEAATSVLAAVCVVCAVLAGQAFRHGHPRVGRLLMLLAGVAGIGLILGRIPLPSAPGGVRPAATFGWYPPLFVLGGVLLLGATHTAMVLGHWYLLMRGLSFGPLVRSCWLAVGAVVARSGLLLVAWAALGHAGTDYEAFLRERAGRDNSFLFGARIALGLAAPLSFGILALRCATLRANQAATGLLYLSEVFVFFGEMLAAGLLL